jgi:Icc protein
MMSPEVTPPPSMSAHLPAQQPTTLLHLTDTHLYAAADSTMRGVNTLDTLNQVLAAVRDDSAWPPAGILATGDLVQDESRSGYERFRDCLAHLGTPVYCIPGNHDDPRLMEQVLSRPPFQVNGQIQLDGWTVLMLSTYVRGDDGGALDKAALVTLDVSLAQHAERHVLIVMHHQPIAMNSAWLDEVGLRDADEFLAVLDRHDNVRGVLWGHVHQVSDRQRNGVRMLSTPATCAQFLPNAEVFALDDKPPGFRWLRLYPDGTLETEVGWVSG